jgi:hypothetical protein
MRARLPILLVLATLLLVAGNALALPAAAPVSPVGEIAPGSEMVTPVPPLPPGTTEFELLLLPEHGRAIQVCPEQRAGVREVRWRMPRVYGRTARLMWRFGGPGTEGASDPSAAFTLTPPPARELAELVGLRSDAARWGEYDVEPIAGFGPPADRTEMGAAHGAWCAVAPDGQPALAPLADGNARDAFRDASQPLQPCNRPRSRAPAFMPLRN